MNKAPLGQKVRQAKRSEVHVMLPKSKPVTSAKIVHSDGTTSKVTMKDDDAS